MKIENKKIKNLIKNKINSILEPLYKNINKYKKAIKLIIK